MSLGLLIFGCIVGVLILGVLIYYGCWRHGEKKHPFNAYTTSEEAIDDLDLSGKTAIVTGCNIGIGKVTARVLLKQGCNVIMACRSEKKAEAARKDILNELGLKDPCDKLTFMCLDLGSLDSVKSFATQFNDKNLKLDYLINNAGVSRLMSGYTTTHDGFEGMFGINHLGHFYLTNLLTPSLFRESGDAQQQQRPRVINVASLGANISDRDYNYYTNMIDTGIKELKFYPESYINEFTGTDGYALAKSCTILFGKELIKKYGNDKIIAVSLQPGAIQGTNLIQDYKRSEIWNMIKYSYKGGLFSLKTIWEETKSLTQGAATTIRCVSIPDDQISNGSFYHNCRAKDESVTGIASDKQDPTGVLSEKVWQLSKVLLEAKGHSM